MQSIDGVNLPFMPIGGVRELNRQSIPADVTQSSSSFQDIFTQELDKVKFSAHAQSRLTSRDINLSSSEIDRLETAINKADEKGANESLILMDEKAFIVSVPNRTVITVVNKDNLQSNIITDIDSAVFA
jgi:flagellar operon protein